MEHDTVTAAMNPDTFYLKEEHHVENGSMLGFWLYLMNDSLILAILFACYGVTLLSRPRIISKIGIMLAIIPFAGFFALGSWQLQRRTWKLDLISRVESQRAKAPIPAPGRDQWDSIGPDAAYLPVAVRETYLHAGETLVQAMTVMGSGFWVITPLHPLTAPLCS